MHKEQKIFIFGGPDRCGKTTIARELSRQTGIPYFKPSGQQKTAIEKPEQFFYQTTYGESKLLDFLRQTGHSAIIDRSFPCDWVYSRVLKRGAAWDAIDMLDREYSKLHTYLIFTLKSGADYSGVEPDSFKAITPEFLARVDEQYRFYAEKTSIPSLIIHTDDKDTQRHVTEILSFSREYD